MTRTYALKRLLEHGPLRFGEIVAVTGWHRKQAWGAVEDLIRSGLVVAEGTRPAVYRLEAS